MRQFIDRYAREIDGVLTGFDHLVPRFLETAQLWVVGRQPESLRFDGDGAVPLTEQDSVQGLLPACERTEPAVKGQRCRAIRGTGLADHLRAQSLSR